MIQEHIPTTLFKLKKKLHPLPIRMNLGFLLSKESNIDYKE